MSKKILITFFKYGIGLALLAWVIWAHWEPANGSPGLKAALQRDINVLPLLIALFICSISLILTFIRWYFLVRTQDLPFSLADGLRLGTVGFAFSTLLPGSIGGDIIKAAFLAREQSRRTVAVATVIFDRVLGLAGLFWLAAILGTIFWLVGDLQHPVLISILWASWAVCGVCVVFWFLLGLVPDARAQALAGRLENFPKIGGSLAELWRAVWLYRCRGHSIWLGLTLAILGHFGFVAVYYFCALALFPAREVPSMTAHYLIIPVGMVIQAGFPAPGGIGGGEFAFGKLYELVGFAFASGVLASLFQRVIFWGLAVVSYLIYLRMRPTLHMEKLKPAVESGLVQELTTAKV